MSATTLAGTRASIAEADVIPAEAWADPKPAPLPLPFVWTSVWTSDPSRVKQAVEREPTPTAEDREVMRRMQARIHEVGRRRHIVAQYHEDRVRELAAARAAYTQIMLDRVTLAKQLQAVAS